MNLLFLARNHELRYSSRSLPSVPLKKTGTRVPRKTEDANSNPYGNIMHDNQHSAQETKRRPVLLHDLLGMEFLPSEPGRVRARLKVEEKVCQISGFMSGGAALALAETLAGFGSLELCGKNETPLGIQVSANHVRAVPMGGEVTATATLLHESRSLHVWNIDITDEKGRLVSSCRVTNCIKQRKSP